MPPAVSRRTVLALAMFVAVVSVCLAATGLSAPSPGAPNIVVILADDKY